MNNPNFSQSNIVPLPQQQVVPPTYDLDAVFNGFTKKQQLILKTWLEPEIRSKKQLAMKLKVDESNVCNFLNESKTLEYLRNYSATHFVDRLNFVDEITFKEACLPGNFKARELYYKRYGNLQQDNTNIQVNTNGEGQQVQIIINPGFEE